MNAFLALLGVVLIVWVLATPGDQLLAAFVGGAVLMAGLTMREV